MNAKGRKRVSLALFLLKFAIFPLAVSCQSTPPPIDEPATITEVAQAVQQGPGQEELGRLDAAMARATGARENAVAVQAQAHFPQEWELAEADYRDGRNAGRATPEAVTRAIASFAAAAERYETLAENSAPLFARDMEEARLAREAQEREGVQQALQAAVSGAEESRRNALNNRASAHFPAEWRDAEAQLRTGRAAGRGSHDEIRAATQQLIALAATYDDLAARSRPLFERDEAQRTLNTAITRAERSRRAAVNANAQGFFPNEWRDAEAHNQAGLDSPRETTAQIQAATARFVSAADAYDDLARRSGPLFTAARNEAAATLQAAVSRADASRRAAMEVEVQTHFPDEWREAEAQNTAARRARRTTPEEMLEAAALLNAAAENYDRLARRSGPIFARERGAADTALQEAMARAQRSREAAIDADGRTNMPAEWRTAEQQNSAANRARRGNTAEIRAAAALFSTAADSFEDIAQRSAAAGIAARNEANSEFQAALARANASRQAAVAVDGQTHFPNDWNRAETQNTAGRNAPRDTVSETRAAAAQLNTAANIFDNVTQRSTALAVRAREEADRALQTAMTRMERSRQAAVNVDAQTHFPAEWRNAEAQNQTATRARTNTPDEVRAATALFVTAADSYDDIARRSGPLFTAARNEANREFQAALTRANASRQAAVAADGQTHFPNDWNRAEAQNTEGRGAPRNTAGELRTATALLTSAANAFDNIAQRSTAVATRAREEADRALQNAIARMERSRQAAMNVEAQTLFPDDWRAAEAQNTAANRARRNTPDEVRAATALFVTAAESYDDIARRSGPLFTAARNEANREFQAALTRADRSRRAAMDVEGQTHFPNDWNRAETQNTEGRGSPRNTAGELRAAAALLTSAADGFDNIAQRSGPLFARARDDANTALQAAIARADNSRQAAVSAEAQVFFPNEWRAAEAQNTAARRARRTTTEEMRAATALFVAVAESYEDIAGRSAPMLAAERREAERALQTAITRAAQTRQRAENTDAATNLPREWGGVDTRHRNAQNARRETLPEMRNAANLYNAVADAFDDLIQRNVRFVQENEAAARLARTNAERERQAAMDVRANIGAPEDFGRADTTFQQALRDFNAGNFVAARNQYTQSANQFVASVRETERRRLLADTVVEQARQRSAQSTTFAITTGLAMEEEDGDS